MARGLAIASILVTALAVVLLWRTGAKRPSTDAPESTAPSPVPAAAAGDAGPALPSPTRRPRPALTPSQIATLDEAVLMARLRELAATDSAQAVELARAGNRRFPDSADAPERSSILIHALANLGRVREARGEAEQMVNHYPDSDWVREIEGYSGAHRHRNLHVSDAGVVTSD
jgi:hypothetical protein